MDKKMHRAIWALSGLCMAALSPLACAMPGDTLQPFVSYSITRDSNLFRLASNPQADTYQIYTGGVLLDWKYAQQEVTGQASVNKVHYSRYTILDTQGNNVQLQWNWKLGRQWSGILGYSNQLSQAPYTNYNTLSFTDTNVTNQEIQFQANYLISPRWQITAGADQKKLNYQATQLQPGNNSVNKLQGGFTYLSPGGSRTGMTYEYSRGQVPGTPTLNDFFQFITIDNNYRQSEIQANIYWRFSALTKIYGAVGYTRRTYNVPYGLPLARDFSGVTGQLTANWQMTGKTSLSAKLYRYLGGFQNVTNTNYYANYVISNGLNLGPTWTLSSKTQASLQAFIERDDYLGNPFNLTGLTQRRDTLRGLTASLTWQPFLSTTLGLVFQVGNRTSNYAGSPLIPNPDFSYRSINFNAQFVF